MQWVGVHWLGIAIFLWIAGHLSWEVYKRMKRKRKLAKQDISPIDVIDVTMGKPASRTLDGRGGCGSGGGAGSTRSYDLTNVTQPTGVSGHSNLTGAVFADENVINGVAATTTAENIVETASAANIEDLSDTIVEVAQVTLETIGETVVDAGAEIISGVLKGD